MSILRECPPSTMKHNCAVPVIATADVRSTVDWYISVLGFAEHFVFGDPPVYAGIQRGSALVYLARDEKLAATIKDAGLHPEVFLWVQDVDKVFAEHKRRGANVVEELADRPWDARQYVIEDPNGYHIKIAEPLYGDED
jgi:uncharacterized glyoxalase superfamily protein PhnB